MGRRLEQLVLAGKYEDALAIFSGLTNPSAQEYRYAAVSFLNLGNLVRARHAALVAVAEGLTAAAIELAVCCRMENDFQGAVAQLAKLDVSQLSAIDAALHLREQAILEEEIGSLSKAALLLDEAWSHAVAAPEQVQASVALSIGLIAEHLGNDVKANAYFEFAEQNSADGKQVFINLARAMSYTYLGQFDLAWTHLSKANNAVESAEHIKALFHYRKAIWYRAQGQYDDAKGHFLKAIGFARKFQRPGLECLACLGIVALATHTGNPTEEKLYLNRARALAHHQGTMSAYELRLGAALAQAGDLDALNHLASCLKHFEHRGCKRENIWALLHIAEAHLVNNNANLAESILNLAADLHTESGRQHYLSIEINSLSHVKQFLENFDESHYLKSLIVFQDNLIHKPVIEVRTLGVSSIYVEGHRIRLQMRKTIELLVYLKKRGSASLSDIQLDLFPEIEPNRSKNYIHQMRNELKRLVPGLTVPYCRNTQTYSLLCNGWAVTIDVEELEAVLHSASGDAMLSLNVQPHEFLAESDNRWVEDERNKMARWITRVGLETMDGWWIAGEFDKCIQLAERLLEIEPYDEGLHDFLIRATEQLHGLRAARAVGQTSRVKFLNEVGQVPSTIDNLLSSLELRKLN